MRPMRPEDETVDAYVVGYEAAKTGANRDEAFRVAMHRQTERDQCEILFNRGWRDGMKEREAKRT